MGKALETIILIFLISIYANTLNAQNLYYTEKASVEFLSVAPLETIYAKSAKLNGILDINSRNFVFTVPISSFEGFNSPLQQVHFNENYLESAKYPKSKFKGKIIEEIDFSKPGTYKVRAKGKMLIHGKESVMTMKGTIIVSKNEAKLKAIFSVFIENFDINIPPIVNQKIAEEIKVTVKADLKKRK